jgi:hypothetical protein
MARTITTSLLELLQQRWIEFVQGLPDPTWDRKVKRPDIDKDRAREAARLHAQAHHADPFAYGRALRYIEQGFWLISEVRTDALRVVQQRKAEGVVFPIVTIQ